MGQNLSVKINFVLELKTEIILSYSLNMSFIANKNWFFATNSDFLIPKSLQPNVVDPWYFKLWIMLEQII